MNRTKRAAIVLAAGKGTRMKSSLTKVLHEANGRPLVAYPVQHALALGAAKVVVVVGHQGERVREKLTSLFPGSALRFAEQKEQKGTAHAVRCAKRALAGHTGRIQILYGDVPLITEGTLRTLAKAGRNHLVSFLTMRPEDPKGYGRVVRDARGRVVAIVEHKDATEAQREIGECNAGLYDVDARFLWSALERIGSKNAQGEFYLTDLVAAAQRAGDPAIGIEASLAELAGVNDKLELAAAGAELRRRIVERHLRAGVTILDPKSCFLDEDVTLEPDAILEPNVQLTGATHVAAHARIGFGSVLHASRVGAGTIVRPYSILEEARVAASCTVGPFARLRPGSELAEGVHIGNFVETKKTKLGRGSKANHLAYLGDATIGARCNIGAGTITCNYDGVNKLPTVLGDEVFIGSDTQLVAPVRIGARSYVGAGSTIVRDVPAGALALSRAAQVVKENWVGKQRIKLTTKKTAARRARTKR